MNLTTMVLRFNIITARTQIPMLKQVRKPVKDPGFERTCDIYCNNVAIRIFIILVYFISNYFQSIKVFL